MILDGWGIGDKSQSDVIYNANTPNIDALMSRYPHSQLLASGISVGLPEGVMGNSEVGHLNIGAGRVLYQDLVKINMACNENTMKDNEQLKKAFSYAKDNNKAVHFVGLVSNGGVHSMNTHLYKLCDITKDYELDKVYIHAITDGRDTDPRSGLGFMTELVEHLKTSNGKIATLIGRYYTMDRDKRWERVKKGYDLMVNGVGEFYEDVLKAIENSYEAGLTDEFINPVVLTEHGMPVAKIKSGDVVICYNYRTDRLREITVALTQKDMPEFDMRTVPLEYYTMTRYDDSFKGIHIIFDKDNVQHTLGEVVSENGLTQIRIAETEKYAHVTFFFSGGREIEFPGETRLLVSSPKVATYDMQPEMSAILVKDKLLPELKKADASFICLNFANGDMVGHTGVYKAITKAVETVDMCVGEVVSEARANGYDVIIMADHGNADFAVNSDGSPNTAHSLNPVPCILVSDNYDKIRDGVLADVAPTVLKIMGLPIPNDMTGRVLV